MKYNNVALKGKNQGGFSLIELVFVIAIIGAFMFLAVTAYQSSNDSAKANQEMQNIASLVGTVRSMFNSQGDYTGLKNEVLLKHSSFSESMRSGSSTELIKNGWNSDGYTVTEDSSDEFYFNVTLKKIPESECVTIASNIFKTYYEVKVGSTVIKNAGDAATACLGASNNIVVKDR